MPLQTSTVPKPPRHSKKKKNLRITVLLLTLWILLVAGGLWGAKWYTDSMKKDIISELSAQNEAQIAKLKTEMDQQIADLQTEVNEDLQQLASKIQTFNELLTFANENATSESDNSTQLYSQLNDIQEQLNELKANLEVLE